MEKQSSKKKSGLSLLRSLPKTTLIMIAGLAGILLIALSPLLARKNAQKDESPDAAAMSAESYADALESKLTAILEKTEGVGKVNVMITLNGGYIYTYALSESMDTDTQRSEKADSESKTQEKISTQKEYILVDGSGGEQPVVTMVNDPEIKGVVVICEGGGDPVVVNRIVEAVKVSLGVGANKIAVFKSAGSDNNN